MPGQEKMVLEYYQKNPSASQSLKGSLYEEKIISLIKSKIKINVKEIDTKEAEKIIESANEAIRNEKNAAVSEIKKQVAGLSIEIAEKLLNEKLSENDKQMKIVDELLKDVKLK